MNSIRVPFVKTCLYTYFIKPMRSGSWQNILQSKIFKMRYNSNYDYISDFHDFHSGGLSTLSGEQKILGSKNIVLCLNHNQKTFVI